MGERRLSFGIQMDGLFDCTDAADRLPADEYFRLGHSKAICTEYCVLMSYRVGTTTYQTYLSIVAAGQKAIPSRWLWV